MCADESYAVGKGRLIIIPRQVAPISPLIYIYDRVSEKERIDQSIWQTDPISCFV